MKVQSVSGAGVSGALVSADADQLTIATGGGAVTIRRLQARRVSFIEHGAGRRAKHGFAAGALTGGLVGALGSASPEWIAFLAAAWGGIGALFGAIDGASGTEWVVYDVTCDVRRPTCNVGRCYVLSAVRRVTCGAASHVGYAYVSCCGQA